MLRFSGKAALITGGTSGIGLATAERLLSEGARAYIVGRDRARLEAALSHLSAFGEVGGACADVAETGDVTRMIDDARSRLGGIDVLVHSAGIDGSGVSVLDLDLAGWRRVLDVNLTGPFLVAQAAGRVMRAKGGSIVTVASLNGLAAEPRFADYNSAKGGLVMLTRSLAVDLVEYGIRVNAVCPGYVLTPMTEQYAADPETVRAIAAAIPMHRFGRPEEVAATIAFLASDDASYITGEVVVVDGGRFARQ